jgi:hypothetical protein
VNFSRLKQLPFHIFLLPVFYILHAVNRYYGLFPFRLPAWYLLCYLVLAAIIYGIGYLLFRSSRKAGLWSIIILIIVFFFGKALDLLRSNSVLHWAASYKIFLPVIAGSLIILTIYIKRSSRAFSKLNIYFNLVFWLFVLSEIIFSSVHYFSGTGKKNNLALQNTPLNIQLANIPDTAKPDIFFIVFDEYTSSVSLKKYLNYDNAWLDSSLAVHGFYIARHSKGNYNATTYSLGSTFDLQYFNYPLEHTPPIPKSILKAQYSFSKSRLPGILEKQGYTIKNIGLLDLEKYPTPQTSYFENEYKSIFYEETIWNRIEKEIGWNIALKFPNRLKKKYKEQQAAAVNHYTSNFKNILTELQTQTATPKFIYGHIFMPHRPYCLNRKGEFINTLFNYTRYSRDSLYLEQLAFCNTWIDSLAKASDKSFNRPRVIIIEGDHGYRDANDEQTIRERELMNLSAYYFSDKNHSLLYDSITPVNSFRVIFNKYFNANLPLLKDSSVLLY